MTGSNLDTMENGGEKAQIVEFKELYPELAEVEDISQLQDKLNIPSSDTIIPIFSRLSLYKPGDNKYIAKGLKSKIEDLFPTIAKKYGNNDNHDIYLYYCRGFPIFNIKQCFSNQSDYIFITETGYVFAAQKEDFDKNGVLSESLNLLGKPEPDENIHRNIQCSEYNGEIKYTYRGAFKGTLPGSCFKYIDTPDDENRILYVGCKSCIYKSTIGWSYEKNVIYEERTDAIDLELGEIKKINLDPKKNLLFVITEDEEGNSNLHILDHRKLFTDENPVIDEIKTITGVSDIAFLSNGNLILDKSDGTREVIITNLDLLDTDGKLSFRMKDTTLNVKKGENKSKKAVIDALGGGRISIEITEVSNEGNEDDKKIIEGIRSYSVTIGGTSKTLKERFDSANSEEDIEMVRKVFFQIIKKEYKLNLFQDLLKEIEKEINNKKQRIILGSIYSELDDILEELKGSLNYSTLFMLKEKLKLIQKRRRNIQVGTVDKRVKDKDQDLKRLIETVDQKIKDYQESHKEEVENEIQNNLEIIKNALNDIENAIDISSIYTSETYKRTEEMISQLDEDGQEKFKKELHDLQQSRLNEIKEKTKKEKREKEQHINSQKREAEEGIKQIKDIIEEIDDIAMVEQIKEGDPLVQKIKKLLSELPSADAQALNLKLDKVFGERIFALRLKGEETKGIVQNLDTYGIDTILYYEEDGSEKVEWKIEGKERPDGKIGLVIKLMNGETHEYDKSLYFNDLEKYGSIPIIFKNKEKEERGGIKFEMTEDEFIAYSSLLSRWRTGGGAKRYGNLLKKLRLLPDTGKDGIITEEKQKILDEIMQMREEYADAIYTEHLISRLIKQQKLNPRSKVPPFDSDYIVLDEEKEILKRLSTRLINQSHNGGIEILEGGPGLGKTVMCEFLASVTNREIVRVQCCNMDPNDMFFSPALKQQQGTYRESADWIKLMQKPGTIILFDEIDKLNEACVERLHSLFDRARSIHHPQEGTIKANPDCLFLGTTNAYGKISSNPILSRSTIITLKYPGPLNECYKISKYTNNPILKKMSYEEFKMLYEKYIIIGDDHTPKNAQERVIYDLIININKLLNIFTCLRKGYESDDLDEHFEYEISYRDSRQIFADYRSDSDFKACIEKVLIPKAKGAVDNSDDKKKQEQLVRDAIEAELG